MLNNDDLGDLVAEMIQARLTNERERLVDILMDLVSGPAVDALNVVLVLAGIVAEDLGDDPEGGYHRMVVEYADGTQASADDLPGHVATFLQMVVAIANNEKATARDLFVGHVQGAAERALSLIVLSLNEVMHQNGLCPYCDLSGEGVVSWTS